MSFFCRITGVAQVEETTIQGEVNHQVFLICLKWPLHILHISTLSCSSRIPSSTDGWMEYVPISEKKKVRAVAQFREGKQQREGHHHGQLGLCLWLCSLVCEGGPLLYDGVQVVQNSASLNGTQRVLLDRVITEEECSALKHLAHVRTPQSFMSVWAFFFFHFSI